MSTPYPVTNGQPLEQVAARRHLARERLGHAGQVRVEQVEQGPRHKLRHPAAAFGQRRFTNPERAPIQTLDE